MACSTLPEVEAPMLFDLCHEILRCTTIGKYNCFSTQSTDFCPANVKNITQLRQFFQCHIIFTAGKSIAKPRSVNK